MGTTQEENENERGSVKTALRTTISRAQALLDYMREAEQDGMCPELFGRIDEAMGSFARQSGFVVKHTDHVLGLGLPTTQDVKARNRRAQFVPAANQREALERVLAKVKAIEAEVEAVLLTGAAQEPPDTNDPRR